MKAVGFTRRGLPASDPASLVDLDLPDPLPPQGRELLVRIHAVSVNPRDVKSRMVFEATPERPVIAGYDAAGVVVAAGPEATLFKPGDAVFYAGRIDRQGSNAELQLVDERIVGPKPASLDDAAAAAVPLTALTAYEMLFDRFGIPQGRSAAADSAVLIVGGAGGVPSMAIQLLRALTGATVVATASRPESERWVRDLGADHVIDHGKPLRAGWEALGLKQKLGFIFSTHTSAESWVEMAAIVGPQGRIGLIDDPPPVDLKLLKLKSASVHWEMMFTRSMFGTEDMLRQHDILRHVAALIDAGTLRATATENYGTINAANLRRAHATIEAGRVIGKIVLAGF